MKRRLVVVAGLVAVAGLAVLLARRGDGQRPQAAAGGKRLAIERGLEPEAKQCIECHAEQEPGKVRDWAQSLHARANVTCIDCHRAQATDLDARDCPGTADQPDLVVSPVVTPLDCSRCHPREAEQFARSKHARTWEITAVQIQDPWLRGMNNAVERATGCAMCHGSDISSGQLTALNWPNEGCGRLNPDDSKGSCVTCHTTHRFSIIEARKPENCGQCHMGPDHPQEEIYFESKHGKRYQAEGHAWNFASAPDAWEPGSDFAAPTCAACHMAGLGPLATTHDVGERLKWEAQAPRTVPNQDHEPEEARARMLTVCSQCHSPRWGRNFLERYDLAIENYDVRYFAPAKKLMDQLYEEGVLSRWPVFDEAIEWTFYEFWHNEGRRARMGAAMMGPDYAWWHGFYELKKHYVKLVHQAAEARRRGHGAPVYIPGSGGKNLTPADLPPMDEAWDRLEHLEGRPPARED
ncbi:MAG: multiheme c-type cytochrome [Candidatus Brocadiia bacterium]